MRLLHTYGHAESKTSWVLVFWAFTPKLIGYRAGRIRPVRSRNAFPENLRANPARRHLY